MVFFRMLAVALSLLLETSPARASDLTFQQLAKRAQCPLASCQQPAPRLPKEDPWYTTTPKGLEQAVPGALFRVRKAPANLPSLVANSAEAYNVLYRTTDSQYKPTYAVATVFVPASPSTNATLLSYQLPYDSVDLNEAPSYLMYKYQTEQLDDIAWALGRGWHVVTGDYEGPFSSFTAGVMSGHAVLDGVRAVLSTEYSGELKLPADTDTVRYALWGYSGGALASEWATELQVQYAPELSFAGAALGGLTPNVTAVRDQVEGTLSAGLIPGWLIGVTSQFPDARAYLLSRLKKDGPYNATVFMGLEQSVSNGATFAFQNISDYLIGGFADLKNPVIRRITYSDGMMGYHGVPQMSVYEYKAIHDELSAGVDTDKLVERYCEAGASIFYQRDTVNDHGEEAKAGAPRARNWLVSVLEQGHTEDGCRIETITDPWKA
ncbi:uncharacterized protein E0L32_001262 [Thyridium curvatum]|uniref:Triacylglycerol lipase n=1 Tax=Thyridium curvatum TaxID=1093900 RepID=A0A507AIP3_9PEZI|nr:uncharacterized protein E0L32_001262 [Thyridium curvatum]TPX10065.1 hypothetical protein E0L32_001262 [Thyridium curvatum]